MANIFDDFLSSAAWTGRGERQAPFALPRAMPETAGVEEAVLIAEAPAVAVEAKEEIKEPEYVPLRYDEVRAGVQTFSPAALREYAEVAAIVGVTPPDMIVEEFKLYLVESGMTVFALKTVVDFMDRKSKAEGRGWGWHWLPLRDKDRLDATFGTSARRREFVKSISGDVSWRGEDRPSSDFYSPLSFGFSGESAVPAYPHTVPLHALKKVAKIEAEFKHPVAFMVSDYAPAPQFRVDPFLMAVVENPRLRDGVGRFVIDVWDEPGFGIEEMLKSDLLGGL